MNKENAQHTIDENLLHAYADGQLTASERQQVEARLAQDPDARAKLAEWQRQNAALGALFPTSEAEARVQNILQNVTTPPRPTWSLPMQLAAALVLIAVGIGGGWALRGATGPTNIAVAQTLVDEAMNAHLIYAAEVLHPVEVAASDEDHLIGWLSKRLGVDLSAPDLSAQGYALIGGRLLPAVAGPAAQFMYEDTGGNRITVFATTGTSGILAAFQFEERDGIGGVYWQDEVLRYAVIGPVARDTLAGLATEVYRQLI